MTVKKHYDEHLAHFYEWMVGDFEAKQKEQQEYFERNGIKPLQNKLAIDLGAGHGLQSVSLANLGFLVKAIDNNKKLLDSLQTRSRDLSIKVFQNDLLSEENFNEPVELIVCMGDTISHLSSADEIQLLLNRCFKCLLRKGQLILSYRDYGLELTESQRFIPVKSYENKILTCFLEYFEDRVRVTDLLQEKINGRWEQRVSSYFKVRITNQMIESLVNNAGFKILKADVRSRMNYLIAEKNKPKRTE